MNGVLEVVRSKIGQIMFEIGEPVIRRIRLIFRTAHLLSQPHFLTYKKTMIMIDCY